MSLNQHPLDLVRQRWPQLREQALQVLRQLPRQLLKLPLRRPRWPLQTERFHWVSWRTLAAAVLLGGIVHICATFVAPMYTASNTFDQLRETLPLNRMTVLRPPAPGRQIVRGLPPDALYAMCRYDLSKGPIAVTATVEGAGWALSVHTPKGENLYVLPGQPSRRIDVSLILVPNGTDSRPIPDVADATDGQVVSPTLEGLVMLRAPLRGLAWAAETEAILKRATCAPAKRQE